MNNDDGVFDHKRIEDKWRGIWRDHKQDVAEVDTAKKPFYNLMMFPYPSAEGLHIGNMYAFTGSDIHGRFKRMQGFDVFEPIGLDGFGIHSENYALKIGRHPVEHAQVTQKNFYRQLGSIGAMFDWTRTVETYDPGYYHWTQWLFIQMFKKGLAYRENASVNWCPSDKTVLADEQVIDGKCERCGNIVEKRRLEQWFFRITAYAEKLLQNTYSLDWPEKVLVAQQQWIGKKEGINIVYEVKDSQEKIVCFTTTPVNWAATFLVLSPEHPLVLKITKADKKAQVEEYIRNAHDKKPDERMDDSAEKTGVFTGSYAINHVNGNEIPIWVSDFVLTGVGTGALQACPAHDTRDFAFAMKYHLPIVRVVVGPDGDTSPVDRLEKVIEAGQAGTMINSGDFINGLPFAEAMEKTKDYFEQKGWGKRTTIYHLRDWLISRQRYWGPPIPMIFCETCKANGKGERSEMPGWWTTPEKDLPLLLPRIDDYKPTGDGSSPLSRHKEFAHTVCPDCGAKAVRETDVSDTFLDSSWYFLRYPTVGAQSASRLPFDPEITKRWLPVSMYTGGAEHSVLHLMYSRFVTMVLHDMGMLSFDEPFPHFYAHGLIIKDGAKMSKSKGNVINPDEYIATYGADSIRLYLMFTGPFNQGGDFRDSAMEGMRRWINRIWKLSIKTISTEDSTQEDASDKTNDTGYIDKILNKLIIKVSDDMEKRRYNTAIASMMEFTNAVSEHGGRLTRTQLAIFMRILAPFAPFITEEVWQMFAGENTALQQSIHTQSWPQPLSTITQDDEVILVVQVNGKLRDTLQMTSDAASEQKRVEEQARQSKAAAYIGTNTVKKVVFVPKKLINFVV